MKVKEIVKEIKEFFIKNSDEELVKKYSRFFREGYDAYGINQDVLYKQKDIWFEKYKSELGLNGFLDLADELFKSGKYEDGGLAVLFLKKYQSDYNTKVFDRVAIWFEKYVKNWAHSDILCGEFMGVFFEKGIISLNSLADWQTSESKFKRRAVPVSMLKLLKLDNEIGYMLDFIEKQMLDKEREVHQGLGWFLREAWKLHPEITEKFLLKWKDDAPRLIFQYATEKMSKEQKERFRKDKSKSKK